MSKLIRVYSLFFFIVSVNHVIYGMEQLPKELLNKIVDYTFPYLEDSFPEMKGYGSDEGIKNNIIEWQTARQYYSRQSKIEKKKEDWHLGKNKEIICLVKYLVDNVKICNVFCQINKRFCTALKAKQLHIKDKLCCILDYVKQDLAYHMQKALELSKQQMRLSIEVRNNIERLIFYTENKNFFIYFDECTNACQTIVPEYLYHALEIPDCIAGTIGQDYAAPPHQEYYCNMLFCMLQKALERTNNTLYIETDKVLNLAPRIINFILDISVCNIGYDADKKQYKYLICKRKFLNNSLFFKKDSTKTCIIS